MASHPGSLRYALSLLLLLLGGDQPAAAGDCIRRALHEPLPHLPGCGHAAQRAGDRPQGKPRTDDGVAGVAGAAVGGAADGGAVAGAAAPPQLGPQPAVAPRLPGGGRSDRGRRRVDLVPGRLGADAQPARSTLSRHPGQRAAGHAACTAWRQSGAARAEAADRHRRQGHPACTGQQAAPAGDRDGRDRARR
ncbi:hypothetical protein G6F57_018668 [Rhizopus arrhizus]|nr:hypothetical protein G6F57_018668 [Rhizopus arrhizus]